MWNEQEQKQQYVQPVVVQGTIVPQGDKPSQYHYAEPVQEQSQFMSKELESGYGNMNDGSYGEEKGEVQPKRFNDIGFAIAFVIHLFLIIGFMVIAPAVVNEDENDAVNINYSGLLTCIGICAAFGIGLSIFMLSFMMKFARQLVKMSLIFSIGMAGVMAVVGLMFGQIMLSVLGLIQFCVGICYAYAVWSRIPFAAANLNTSLTAVKSNLGLVLVGFFFTSLATLWTVRWMITSNVALAYFGQGALFFLFLSYFWTHQVLQVRW